MQRIEPSRSRLVPDGPATWVPRRPGATPTPAPANSYSVSKYALLDPDDIVGLHQIIGFGLDHDLLSVLSNALYLDAPVAALGGDAARDRDGLNNGQIRFELVHARL